MTADEIILRRMGQEKDIYFKLAGLVEETDFAVSWCERENAFHCWRNGVLLGAQPEWISGIESQKEATRRIADAWAKEIEAMRTSP